MFLQVAVYVPGSKGAPSFVRLYQYPLLGGPTAALANKSFFKADKVSMEWNKKGGQAEDLNKDGHCDRGSFMSYTRASQMAVQMF